MTPILKQLKKQRKNLVAVSEMRDEKYLKKKEAWQASITGVIYNEKTGKIADVISKLDEAINELEQFLNDC